jgi:hypothetical protein
MTDDPETQTQTQAKTQTQPSPPSPKPRVPLPPGYRQGVITAITVLLGFSLLFLRYWNFELPGTWNLPSVVAAVMLSFAVLLEIVALWRSLQVEDDDEEEYRVTLRWFLSSAILLLLSLLLAALSLSRRLQL